MIKIETFYMFTNKLRKNRKLTSANFPECMNSDFNNIFLYYYQLLKYQNNKIMNEQMTKY